MKGKGSKKKKKKRKKKKRKKKKKKKVLIVEDLISTGKSSLNVAEALKKAGCDIIGIISIFNYNFPETEERLKNQKIKYSSLCSFNDLIKQAELDNYILKKEIDTIIHWHSNFHKKS